MSYSYRFHCILIGDTHVGKSCLLRQFTEKKFYPHCCPTIGVDFGARLITVQQQPVKLQLWDTAGQEDFLGLTRSYYRRAAGALLVYDTTRRDTFLHVSRWLKEVKQNALHNSVVVLVGNKSDLRQRREVSMEEGKSCAEKNGLLFVETSAKTAQNVEEAFLKVANAIYSEVQSGTLDISSHRRGIQLDTGVDPPQQLPHVLSNTKSQKQHQGYC